MDSKIILSILIVALIGVVSAAYHEQIEDMDLLTGLDNLVNSQPDDVSDSQQPGDSIPGGSTIPATGSNGGSVMNTKIYNHNPGDSPQHNSTSKTGTNRTISINEGYNAAKKWVNEKMDKKGLKTNPVVKYVKTEDNVYLYNILDNTNKVIGYVEVDMTRGVVTGGAVLGEAPTVNDAVDNGKYNVNNTVKNSAGHVNSSG